MRLTLWQQFSSNHSGSYRIVGSFDSPAKAEKVAQTVRHILDQIVVWRNNHEAQTGTSFGAGQIHPTPATPLEVDIGRHFGMEWTEGIDWLFEVTDVPSHIQVFDRWVFLDSGITWQQKPMLDELLTRLGSSSVIVGQMGITKILFDVHAAAADQASAQAILNEVGGYFQRVANQSYDTDIPWIVSGYPLDRLIALEGRIHLNGTLVAMTGMRISPQMHTLQAIINYLTSKGCNSIEWNCYQAPDPFEG